MEEKGTTIRKILGEIMGSVFRMPRFAPAIFALAFLPLSFIRDLGQQWYRLIVPALVVYGIGAAILGMIHRMIALSSEKRREVIIKVDEVKKIVENISLYTNNEMTILWWKKIVIYLAHLVWLALFIWYLNRVWVIRF